MSEVEELAALVGNLPSERLAQFRDWFYKFENELFDRQIKSDFKAGKFAGLIDQARKEFAKGKVREL